MIAERAEDAAVERDADGEEAARGGRVTNLGTLMYALSLETWLAVKAGRWLPSREPARAA